MLYLICIASFVCVLIMSSAVGLFLCFLFFKLKLAWLGAVFLCLVLSHRPGNPALGLGSVGVKCPSFPIPIFRPLRVCKQDAVHLSL